MRWPFRRKGADPAPEAAASHADAGAVPVPATRRSAQHWLTMPPLPVTIKPTAPLVMGPAPVLEPLPGARKWSGAPIPPATGRVEALLHPVPVVPEPAVPAAPQAPVVQPSLVHRTVHSGPPVPVSSLTDAVGEYVGEAREPAEPYRAPGWMRFVPEWLQQGGTSEADLGMASAGRPLNLPTSQPEPSRPESAAPKSAPVVPQRLTEESAENAESSTIDTPVVTSAPRLRRASLGQSRRLGLGAPLRQGSEQELTLPPEPPRIEAPQAIPAPIAEPAQASGPAPTADDTAEEAPEPPPAPPPQPPPLVHRPPRAEEPAEEPEPEPVRPSPIVAGPVAASVAAVTKPAPPSSSVPLVYRSAPPKPEPEAKPVTRRAKVIPVPTGLASAIRSSHGVDVSDVLVHRSSEVSAEARSLGARAFTRDAEVFLPEEAGSLDAPQARSLLAHELVHVVQQRKLGTSLPTASTSAGMALEAEAVAAEHVHAEPAAPLVHPVLTQVLSQAARTAGVQLAPLVPESISAPTVATPSSSTSDTVLSEPARQQVDQISQESATRVIEQWTNPALGGSGFTAFPVTESPALPLPSAPSAEPGSLAGTAAANEAEMANQVLQVINLDRAAKGEPAMSVLDERALAQIRQVIAEQTSGMSNRAMMMATSSAAATGAAMATEASTSVPDQPSPAPAPAVVEVQRDEVSPSIQFGQADTDPGRDDVIEVDRLDLDELSARLYDRLRSRLRMELLVDRERAGLLTDFR